MKNLGPFFFRRGRCFALHPCSSLFYIHGILKPFESFLLFLSDKVLDPLTGGLISSRVCPILLAESNLVCRGELEVVRLRGYPKVTDPLNLNWVIPAKGETIQNR